MSDSTTHIYLIPGLFGFARLAGHDYFVHLDRALHHRYRALDRPVQVHVIPTPPTASLMVRAGVVAQQIAAHSTSAEQIHLVGHSTGGLDARLLLCQHTRMSLAAEDLAWRQRVKSLVTINTPHFGTPLAGYFTSAAGTRLLYALSLLTVTSLSVGKLPLTAVSSILTGLSTLDDKLGFELRLLDQITAYILRYVGEDVRAEFTAYLDHVRQDRGGIVQLMPESMGLFNATVIDNDAVRYGCVVTAAPAPAPRHLASSLLTPMSALSRAIYTIVYQVAAAADRAYPYAHPDAAASQRMRAELGYEPDNDAVDGIVPTLSMLWGEVLYCGRADHLDVVGHFGDDVRPEQHVDWLESGARFTRAEFQRMVTAICNFQFGQRADVAHAQARTGFIPGP